jgi:hypothetical protein
MVRAVLPWVRVLVGSCGLRFGIGRGGDGRSNHGLGAPQQCRCVQAAWRE